MPYGSGSPSSSSSSSSSSCNPSSIRDGKILKALENWTNDKETLANLVWTGVPLSLGPVGRARCWRLLLGISENNDQRQRRLQRYRLLAATHFEPLLQDFTNNTNDHISSTSSSSSSGTQTNLAFALNLRKPPPADFPLEPVPFIKMFSLNVDLSRYSAEGLATDTVTEPLSLKREKTAPNFSSIFNVESMSTSDDSSSFSKQDLLRRRRKHNLSDKTGLPDLEDLPDNLPADQSEIHTVPPPVTTGQRKKQAELNIKTFRQIRADLIRTSPDGFPKMFRDKRIQLILTRVLLLCSISNPAAGYVQGMNDIAVPFLIVFLLSQLKQTRYLDILNLEEIEEAPLIDVEIDLFWAMDKIILNLQDNLVQGQPGIHTAISKMSSLVKRLDKPLFQHLEKEGAQIFQFSFRWMNCILARELPTLQFIRLWDVYLAEGLKNMMEFHSYVCAVFLMRWSRQLQKLDFQQLLLFLQDLPTKNWTDEDISITVSEAFLWKSVFQAQPPATNISSSILSSSSSQANQHFLR